MRAIRWATATATVTATVLMGVLLAPNSGLAQPPMPPSLAQTPTLTQADVLYEAAETLAGSSSDADAISAAYEQALAAYDRLGDLQSSLNVLRDLVRTNIRFCRSQAAVTWANQAVGRLTQPDARQRYTEWVLALGQLYGNLGQIDQAQATYETGLAHLATLPQSLQSRSPIGRYEAQLLRSQLLLPQSAEQAQITRQRLIDLHQRLGTSTQVDELLNDAEVLFNAGRTSPELLQEVLKISQQIDYQGGEMRAFTLLGRSALQTQDYASAMDYSQRMLALAERLHHSDAYRAEAILNLGQIYQALGNASMALDAYSQLFDLLEQDADVLSYGLLLDALGGLGELAQQTGETDLHRRVDQVYRIRTSELPGRIGAAIPPPVPTLDDANDHDTLYLPPLMGIDLYSCAPDATLNHEFNHVPRLELPQGR